MASNSSTVRAPADKVAATASTVSVPVGQTASTASTVDAPVDKIASASSSISTPPDKVASRSATVSLPRNDEKVCVLDDDWNLVELPEAITVPRPEPGAGEQALNDKDRPSTSEDDDEVEASLTIKYINRQPLQLLKPPKCAKSPKKRLYKTPPKSKTTIRKCARASVTDEMMANVAEMSNNIQDASTSKPTTGTRNESIVETTRTPSIEPSVFQSVSRSSSAPLNLVPSHTCLMCPGEGTELCQDCKMVSYCSQICRNKDAVAHGLLCRTWKEFQTPPHPSRRRAILIPENSDAGAISFVWLQFHANMNDMGQGYDMPLLGEHFVVKRERFTTSINYNSVLGRALEHTINIVSFLDEGSPFIEVNENVAALIDARFAHPWKGTILAYGSEGISQSLLKRDDLGLHDFRHVLDYLNSQKSTAVLRPTRTLRTSTTKVPDMRYYGRTVRGVRILSDGEIHEGEEGTSKYRDRFEEVCVPVTHAVFHHQTSLLPIPEKVGIPIYKSPYPRTPRLDKTIQLYKPGARVDFNSPLRYLDVISSLENDEMRAKADVNSINYPWAKQFYQGSAILARADQKPLYPDHVEALWVFIQYYLEPKWALASNLHNNDMDQVESEITPEKFGLYCAHMQTFLRSRGAPESASPYDVKKRRGTLKRKRSTGLLRSSKRLVWEWSSDGDEDDNEEEEED